MKIHKRLVALSLGALIISSGAYAINPWNEAGWDVKTLEQKKTDIVTDYPSYSMDSSTAPWESSYWATTGTAWQLEVQKVWNRLNRWLKNGESLVVGGTTITNNDVTKEYFIPTKTQAEIDSFLAAQPTKMPSLNVVAGIPITNCTELQNMQNDLTADYIILNNIDCSETSTWNAGAGFDPVGTFDPSSVLTFSGSLNGNGYTITGLTINRPTEDYVGLFGYLRMNGKTISNLNFVNPTISGKKSVGIVAGQGDTGGTFSIADIAITGGSITATSYYVGGVIGQIMTASNSTNTINLSNITAEINITANNSGIGGVVGYTGAKGIIENVHANGIISGGPTYVGGVAGRMQWGSLNNSSASVNISATGTYTGGLVGGAGFNNSIPISNSYATGDVAGASNYVGGLVGGMNWGDISNSYATGNVTNGTGTFRTGGLVGGFWANAGKTSSITNSYATGNVTSAGSRLGGLLGEVGGSGTTNVNKTYAIGNISGGASMGGLVGNHYGINTFVTNSYWDTTTSVQATSADGTGKTTTQMKQQATFSGWDFTNVWQIAEGSTYPTLR